MTKISDQTGALAAQQLLLDVMRKKLNLDVVQ